MAGLDSSNPATMRQRDALGMLRFRNLFRGEFILNLSVLVDGTAFAGALGILASTLLNLYLRITEVLINEVP